MAGGPPSSICIVSAVIDESVNQFCLTRAALSTGGRPSNFLSLCGFDRGDGSLQSLLTSDISRRS